MRVVLIIFFLSCAVLGQAQSIGQAQTEFDRGNFKRAETLLRDILANDHSQAEAWALLSRVYAVTGKQSADTLAQAPAAIHDAPYFLVAKGIAALSKNDRATAHDHFEKAVDETKGKNAALLQLIADANIESVNGDDAYALAVLGKAKKRDKKNAALRVSEGMVYRKQHNGTEAYKSFTEAIQLNDKEAKAYYQLGNLFLTQKNTELYTEYFNKAIAADPQFAPALYELYQHYLYRDPAQAKQYFLRYADHADHSVQQDYSYTDLLYLTKNYDSAIVLARQLISSEGDKVQPRLYKLISYSLQEKGDTANALSYMTDYFRKGADSNFIVKDFETMALLYRSQSVFDSAAHYYEKAVAMATSTKDSLHYFQTLATLAKSARDNEKEAFWRKQIYTYDPSPSNVALFNWGLAAYKAEDYEEADSAFALYATKYADQGHGYYWRARSHAAMDSAIEKGLAVPYYRQLIEVVKDDSLSEQDKKWMKEALGYLGTYEANTEKDYPGAIAYFEELLTLDPANEKVIQSIEILQKSLAAEGSGSQ